MARHPDILAFEGFTLDRANRRLARGGEVIDLGSRYLDALLLLVETPGALVTKERFMREVWRGIPVTDEALTQCIRTLRRALGERAGEARFIETVPKHGYRFVAALGDPAPARTGNSPNALGGRIAGAATLGGAVAGALGGLFYGAAATGGGSAIVVMAVLVAALGVLGGAGVGIGMGIAAVWRGAGVAPLAVGGGAGGLMIGAIGSILGQDGIAALTGASLPGMTGLAEGLVLGLTAGLGTAFALRSTVRPAVAIPMASLGGALAGATIALAGGSLLGRSLLFLAAQFPRSNLDLARVGALFGDDGFFMVSQLATSALEAATFTACITAAMTRLKGR